MYHTRYHADSRLRTRFEHRSCCVRTCGNGMITADYCTADSCTQTVSSMFTTREADVRWAARGTRLLFALQQALGGDLPDVVVGHIAVAARRP